MSEERKELTTAERQELLNRGGVEVEIQGKKRVLFYDLNALAAIERKYNEEIGLYRDPNSGLDRQVRFTDLLFGGNARTSRIILWAGLLREMPDLTLDQIGELVTMRDLSDLVHSSSQAIRNVMPETSEEDGDSAGADPTRRTPGAAGPTSSATASDTSAIPLSDSGGRPAERSAMRKKAG